MKNEPITTLGLERIRVLIEAYLGDTVKTVKPESHLRNLHIAQLEAAGVIQRAPNPGCRCYVTTPKGNALIKILGDTPLPVSADVWEDSRTQKWYHPYPMGGPKTVA